MDEIIVKKPRGFAAMDPEKRRRICSLGGKAMPNELRAYSKNRELAATSGRKGGSNVDPAKRGFAVNPELARSAGSKGGRVSSRRRATSSAQD